MNKKFKKITGLVTTGALVLTLGAGAMVMNNTTVLAASVEEDVQTESTFERFAQGLRGQKPEGLRGQNLEGLRGQKPEGMVRGEMPEAFEGREKSGRQVKGNKQQLDFTTLVEAGLLSEAQVVDIELLKEENDAARSLEREETKALVEAMTEEERQAYFEEKRAEEKPKLFDILVEEGIIDTTEAEAIEAYLQETRASEKAAAITSKLEVLVTDGTLSSAELEAVISYLNEMGARERVKAVEGEEVERISPFDEMVEELIIDEAQAEAIEALMKAGQRIKR